MDSFETLIGSLLEKERLEGLVLLLYFKIAPNGRIIEYLRLTPKSASGGLLNHSTIRRYCCHSCKCKGIAAAEN
jgi:hypothetical protein